MCISKTNEVAIPGPTEVYAESLPPQLRDILVPADPAARAALADAVGKLRLLEEEREYVMELQRLYSVPIRPNESVKRTMIRVRLALLKLRRSEQQRDDSEPLYIDLPVDPLE